MSDIDELEATIQSKVTTLEIQQEKLIKRIEILETEQKIDTENRARKEVRAKHERRALVILGGVLAFSFFSVNWEVKTEWLNAKSDPGSLDSFVNFLPVLVGLGGLGVIAAQQKTT